MWGINDYHGNKISYFVFCTFKKGLAVIIEKATLPSVERGFKARRHQSAKLRLRFNQNKRRLNGALSFNEFNG